jgi:hypothetical protein
VKVIRTPTQQHSFDLELLTVNGRNALAKVWTDAIEPRP